MIRHEYNFPEFDTSFWKVKDKEWMSKRAACWPRIEQMIKLRKSARGRSIVKQYYMKGKLPDWDKLRDWNSDTRHLDLFLFLWLHPSDNKDFLINLRDQYIGSKVVTKYDIGMGFGIFIGDAGVMASQSYSDDQVEQGGLDHIVVTGENEFYFDVMMQGCEYLDDGVELLSLAGNPPRKFDMKYPRTDLYAINTMSKWLCVKNMRPINQDMLYQYDRPLDWWYDCRTQDEGFFRNHAQTDALRKTFRTALYRIHHFDTDKEGDTGRTRMVHKLFRILDERPFIKDFEGIWNQVKSGEVQIEDAFDPPGY